MTQEKDCIFCKIIAGEIPCHKIYENDAVLAFLDIHPASNGHTLLAPKQHQDHLTDLPLEICQELDAAAYLITNKLRQRLNPKRVARVTIGLDVAHAHLHLIPVYVGGEVQINQDMNQEPDHSTLAIAADELKVVI